MLPFIKKNKKMLEIIPKIVTNILANIVANIHKAFEQRPLTPYNLSPKFYALTNSHKAT